MGYKAGEGLGKTSSGRAEPVEESIHKGRRGLGYILEGLEKEDVKWEQEEVSAYGCWIVCACMYMYSSESLLLSVIQSTV